MYICRDGSTWCTWSSHSRYSLCYALSYISQTSSMRPPYGTCGESPLDLYDPGTTYSRSRCTQQCSTRMTASQCGCIDGYMPGIYSIYSVNHRELIGILPHEKNNHVNMKYINLCCNGCAKVKIVIYGTSLLSDELGSSVLLP